MADQEDEQMRRMEKEQAGCMCEKGDMGNKAASIMRKDFIVDQRNCDERLQDDRLKIVEQRRVLYKHKSNNRNQGQHEPKMPELDDPSGRMQSEQNTDVRRNLRQKRID